MVAGAVTVFAVGGISECSSSASGLSHPFELPLCSFLLNASTISLFVLLSWGSLYSVYLSNTLSISVDAYWNNLLELLKIIKAISQSHKTLSS